MNQSSSTPGLVRVLALLLSGVLLAGCGLKGELYLPESGEEADGEGRLNSTATASPGSGSETQPTAALDSVADEEPKSEKATPSPAQQP